MICYCIPQSLLIILLLLSTETQSVLISPQQQQQPQQKFQNKPMGRTRLLQQSQLPNQQNLLRIDSIQSVSSSNLTLCASYNGLMCVSCKQGYSLTNGKCYQDIPNCIVQYMNVCTTCQSGYKPSTSLVNSVNGQASTIAVNCVLDSMSITNSSSTANISNSSVNPLTLLGKQSFVQWNSVETRYPTDVYLVMIWNFLDGNEDLRVKVKIQDSILQSSVQGKVKDSTDKLTLINWIIQNQFTNFVEGLLIDISNIFFYRVRYKTRSSQLEYEVLAVIHEVNFQITLLQHLQVTTGNVTNLNSTAILNSTLSESEQIRALRQEVLDLKMQASQQREMCKQRQLLFLIFSQYSMLLPSTVQTDPGCIMIRSYLQNKFADFIALLKIDSNSSDSQVYSWMNFEVINVFYRKSDSIDKEYLYQIRFTDDVSVMAQFVLGRLYELVDVKVVYTQ